MKSSGNLSAGSPREQARQVEAGQEMPRASMAGQAKAGRESRLQGRADFSVCFSVVQTVCSHVATGEVSQWSTDVPIGQLVSEHRHPGWKDGGARS